MTYDNKQAEQHTGERIVPIIEEEATIQKREVETGEIVIRKNVHQSEHFHQEELFHEEIEVEQLSRNQVVEQAREPYMEGTVLVVPLYEERVIVQKQLHLIGELRVSKKRSEEVKEISTVLKKEEAIIERQIPNQEY